MQTVEMNAEAKEVHRPADLRVRLDGHEFHARLNSREAPKACALFRSWLPYRQSLIHVRWSGEAGWIPLGDVILDVPLESATSHPAPGQFLMFPGGVSEAEILLAYGPACFASKTGQLAGSPFLTILSDLEILAALGRDLLWRGAKEIVFVEA